MTLDAKGRGMNGGLAAKVVAVFGDGIEVLLYGYYLQRFGIKADIYFSDSSAPKVASNHIVSTWLCLQRDPFAKKIAVQGVAELREIAIDLGAKMLASEAGSTIFECRPEYVDALGQFADECRAQGLLVEFSRNVRSMGFPLGTLAAIRFLQDVSIYPRTLSGGLIESFVERGGKIFRDQNFDQLRCVENQYEMALGEVTRRYDMVVLGGDYASGSCQLGESPSEYPVSSMGIFGRYLSFERATQILKRRDEIRPAQSKRSFFGQLLRVGKSTAQALERPSWPGIEPLDGVKNVFTVSQSGDLAHSIAAARALGEFVRFLDDRVPDGHFPPARNLATEPQSIPWII